uniref:NADH-plastoquinone oxidoreductase subunit 4 n=1 Tax=Corydalis mucronifera TaxID=2878456 RepID=A0A8K1ZSX1_9MAGN|nr:NADH-plastoquinone oxidoreductase subunit 4 [Corydalis mucronifera]UHJ17506.1 NADH-plastoquinone oxidoreductase subunit 4 [Corydalis mucronifera]
MKKIISSTGFLVKVYLVFTTNSFPWLTIIVMFPISAGSSIFFFPHRGNKMIRWYTLSICTIDLLLTTYAFCYHFQFDDPLIQFEQDFRWIHFLDFHWRLGIDGISIGPVFLTGFITTLATLAARPVTRDSRLFHFLMLAMYSGQIGSFSSRDLLLFFIMWEFEIADYTLTYMITRYPWGGTLQYVYASSRNLIQNGNVWIGSDQYGILTPRSFSIFSLVDDTRYSSNNLCSFNISWPTQFQKENSVFFCISYMGFTILGIGSIIDTGLNGAILKIISHGFIGGALFFLAGTSYDRIRLVYLDEIGRIAIPMPKLFTMFSSFSMASLALPGMSGFVAELGVFFGIITSPKSLLMPKILITFGMAIGMIVTPIYSLSMSRQMFYGYKQFPAPNSSFLDSGPRELFVSICIFLPVIGIGIYPDFLLSLSVDKVEVLLSNYFYR